MINVEWIRVAEAAEIMGKEKSAFFRLLKKENIPISHVYDDDDPALRGQKISAIRKVDFERFRQGRKKLIKGDEL